MKIEINFKNDRHKETCRYVTFSLITLFKSKLLVLCIYWESIYIFLFLVTRNGKKKEAREKENSESNLTPEQTDSEEESDVSQTTSDPEEEAEMEEEDDDKTSDCSSVVNNTASPGKRLVTSWRKIIYKYMLPQLFGKMLVPHRKNIRLGCK